DRTGLPSREVLDPHPGAAPRLVSHDHDTLAVRHPVRPPEFLERVVGDRASLLLGPRGENLEMRLAGRGIPADAGNDPRAVPGDRLRIEVAQPDRWRAVGRTQISGGGPHPSPPPLRDEALPSGRGG